MKQRNDLTALMKAQLHNLENSVLDAQYEVDQCQVIVDSLTQKTNSFQGYLATADYNQSAALSNRNLKQQLLQNAKELEVVFTTAFDEASAAKLKSAELAGLVKQLADELIYAVEVINKLSNLVIRKKALNPLISDELVGLIGTTGTDANNAVALTLAALKSVYETQSANIQSEALGSLGSIRSRNLLQTINEIETADHTSDTTTNLIKPKRKPLGVLLDDAYEHSKTMYDMLQHAGELATRQLNHANTSLNKAQVKLSSLQSALNALKAAAIASS